MLGVGVCISDAGDFTSGSSCESEAETSLICGACTERPVQAWPAGFSGLGVSGGCAEPRGVRSRRLCADAESMSKCRPATTLSLWLCARVSGGPLRLMTPGGGGVCLPGSCEVGASAPDGPATARGAEPAIPPAARCLAKPPGRMGRREDSAIGRGGGKFTPEPRCLSVSGWEKVARSAG